MNRQRGKKNGTAAAVGSIGAFILGVVLITATFGKVAEPIVFVEQIRNEGLDVFFSANTVALIALAVEMWLGVALLLGDRSRWILVPATVLVAFFLFITGRTYWLVLTGEIDNTYDCGCFGVFLQRTATEAFWQDLFLLVPPLLMCFVGRRSSGSHRPSWRFWIGVVGAVIVVAYVVVGIGLPAEDLVEFEEPVSVTADGTFRLTDDYALLIEGKEDPTAQIYQSEETLQFLVLSAELSFPLLLDLRGNEVSRLTDEMIIRRDGNKLDLVDSVSPDVLGSFEVGAEGLTFTWKERMIQIRSR
jgi:hypothetical protein